MVPDPQAHRLGPLSPQRLRQCASSPSRFLASSRSLAEKADPSSSLARSQDAIFEDFAGEAVALCRKSLVDASAQIAAQPSAVEGQTAQDKEADGTLFLVRHLLLLKEMVRSVDLVHVERAADFSSVTGASL